MINYKDRAFCMHSKICLTKDCDRKLTPADALDAAFRELPIQWANLDEGCFTGVIGSFTPIETK